MSSTTLKCIPISIRGWKYLVHFEFFLNVAVLIWHVLYFVFLFDNLGNTEWSFPWKESRRRKLLYCAHERWVSWKCPTFHLWDILSDSSAYRHGVCYWFSFNFQLSCSSNIFMKHVRHRRFHIVAGVNFASIFGGLYNKFIQKSIYRLILSMWCTDEKWYLRQSARREVEFELWRGWEMDC